MVSERKLTIAHTKLMEIEHKINKYCFRFVFVVFVLFWCQIKVYEYLEFDDLPSLISRSGSLITSLAFFMELWVNRKVTDTISSVRDLALENKIEKGARDYIVEKFNKDIRFYIWQVHIILVSGTIIWGYGDILFSGH